MVTLLRERTLRRQIAGTTDLVERIADAPEPGDVLRISDRLSRADGEVTLDRQIVRRVEQPIALLRSSIDAKFQFQGEVYENTFRGAYEWENSSDKPAEMRIVFPRPQGGGTLSGFHLRLGALDIVDPDAETGEYSWSGTIPPHGRVAAIVGYRKEGSRSYRYEPGAARIGGLEFRTRGDRVPAFDRASLLPSDVKGASATWRLDDVQVGAPIAFAFPSMVAGKAERDRALLFAPLALGVLALAAWLLRAERSVAATAAFGFALLGIAVLAPYLPPVATVLVGAMVAGVAGGKALGSHDGAFLGVAAAGLAAAPALIGHSTLALWGLGLLVLGPALIRGRREVPVRSRAYVA